MLSSLLLLQWVLSVPKSLRTSSIPHQAASSMYLFGGDLKWSSGDWIASDDRVRGGSSQSYFDIDGDSGRFHGDLDIETLGGAGFASQRSTGSRHWNLSDYDGLGLEITEADDMKYTIILKDTILDKDSESGREQATVSYEYDFRTSERDFVVPWSRFKPTYRGKEKPHAPALDSSNIKRVSIMVRSFFGGQHGTFSISIKSIRATALTKESRDQGAKLVN